MAKITWSNLALEDLRGMYDYITPSSPSYASRLLDLIIKRVEQLEKHPRIGRKVPEFNNEHIRELIEGNYRIIYQIKEEKIGISRIHHSSRLLGEL